MAHRALLLLALLADLTPRAVADPVLAAERLGNSFQSKGPEEDRGLKVSLWWNLTLEREERWHCTENGEWFFRARPGIFVLTQTDGGGWVTRPLERIVHRDGKWRRISLPGNSSPQKPN